MNIMFAKTHLVKLDSGEVNIIIVHTILCTQPPAPLTNGEIHF